MAFVPLASANNKTADAKLQNRRRVKVIGTLSAIKVGTTLYTEA